MTKRFATAPALTSSALPLAATALGKRASRTGPVALMKELTACNCPEVGASPTCGFPLGNPGVSLLGLLPPTVGWEWHWKQLNPLKDGPRPGIVDPPVCATGPTTATVSKTVSASNQNPVWLPPLAITLPAPSAGGLVCAGCTVSMQFGAVGNLAPTRGPAGGQMARAGFTLPTGRGPGSVCAWSTVVPTRTNRVIRETKTSLRDIFSLSAFCGTWLNFVNTRGCSCMSKRRRLCGQQLYRQDQRMSRQFRYKICKFLETNSDFGK